MADSDHNSKKLDKAYQKGLIITDDIPAVPILDFDKYKQVITDIIEKSYPKFSIGVFGEWGTGKTTLMKSVYNGLKTKNNKSIVPVWFNAWRYERENQFALFPLLQTIANSIPDKDENKKTVKEVVSKFGRGFLKGLIKSAPELVTSALPSFLGKPAAKIAKMSAEEISNEFISMLDKVSESVINETLYSTEIESVEKAILKVRETEDFKIVVFIDDLDRCSPNKALEVLESIKVFLDLDGFIFVMGLSHIKIAQLITAYYKEKYKEIGIEGEQYLKKIIQIPINLPIWNAEDIEKLVKDFVENDIVHENYKEIIKQKIPLISTAIENNPREIKRFLNNFIIVYELSKLRENFDPDPEILLLLQGIQLRWNTFYELFIISDKEFRDELKKYISLTEDQRNNILDLDKIEQDNEQYKDYNESIRRILKPFKINLKLWNLLSQYKQILEKIGDNLEQYRRATDVIKDLDKPLEELGLSPQDISHLVSLLQLGKIKEFNKERERFKILDLPGKTLDLGGYEFARLNLSGANLASAHLSSVDHSNANFSNANLSNANFSNANLSNANLLKANLSGANLLKANLSGAKLINSNLSSANLSGAKLTNANLSDANLSNANLSSANFYSANLSGAKLTNANLSDAILSSANLSYSDLSDVDLSYSDLSDVDLSSANLSGAKLINARFINIKNCPLSEEELKKRAAITEEEELKKIAAITEAIKKRNTFTE